MVLVASRTERLKSTHVLSSKSGIPLAQLGTYCVRDYPEMCTRQGSEPELAWSLLLIELENEIFRRVPDPCSKLLTMVRSWRIHKCSKGSEVHVAPVFVYDSPSSPRVNSPSLPDSGRKSLRRQIHSSCTSLQNSLKPRVDRRARSLRRGNCDGGGHSSSTVTNHIC